MTARFKRFHDALTPFHKALSITVAVCPPHRVVAPTVSGLVRTKPSPNSLLPRLPTGGGSPRDRARGPPPAVPLKRTIAGVHAVAVRPRGGMHGPAKPVSDVDFRPFSKVPLW